MDADRFDAIARSLSALRSRRGATAGIIGGVLGLYGIADGEARGRKGKKKNKGKGERCGSRTCSQGTFCCDPANGRCCGKGDECCNVGENSGTCCSAPNRCGRPWGKDNARLACCPPKRQWFTTVGIVRCCPEGTRSLGAGITSDDGPCCPEEKYCGPGNCCSDLSPICVNASTGQCCTEENRCGDECCLSQFGYTCCEGKTCCATDRCYDCTNGSCIYRCDTNQFCDRNGVCDDCGEFGCGG